MMLTLCVVFITTQNCSFLICILISCHWKSVYSWLIIVVRSSTHFHFIPYTFCLYVILTSSFLQGSLCAPSNSTGRHFINLSLPMCGFSIPVIMFETNLCLFPPPFLPCVTAAGCRLPAGEELIFFLVFSALFHAPACFWVGFQLPAQGGKAVYQQVKATSFSLTQSGHMLAASSKCLCVLLLGGIEFLFSIVPGMGLYFDWCWKQFENTGMFLLLPSSADTESRSFLLLTHPTSEEAEGAQGDGRGHSWDS